MKFRIIRFLLASFVIGNLSLAEEDVHLETKEIKIKVFYKSEIAPFAEQIFLLCKQVYQEYPYLYHCRDEDGYDQYFNSMIEVEHSIACIAFDKDKVVGVASGVPIKDAKYNILGAFGDKNSKLNELYYFGELILLKEYRKQGIGKLLYRNLETAVKEMKIYSSIGLCQMEDSRYESRKPDGYIPNDGLWKKFGFIHHPELSFNCPWVNVGEKEESPHCLVFWIKKLD